MKITLKYAEAGEKVIVTAHGNPVARLVRLASSRQPESPQPLDKLAWIRRGQGGNALGLPAGERLRLNPGDNLSDLLLEDRA